MNTDNKKSVSESELDSFLDKKEDEKKTPDQIKKEQARPGEREAVADEISAANKLSEKSEGPAQIGVAEDFEPPAAKNKPGPKPDEKQEDQEEKKKLTLPKIKLPHPKIPAIVVAAIIIILLCILSWYFYFAKGSIVTMVSPADATVQIGSITASASETIKLKPGNYDIKISKTGYIEYEQKVAVKRFKTTPIKVALKNIPAPQKLLNIEISNFYIINNEIYIQGNGGKTLYKLKIDPVRETSTPSTQETIYTIKDLKVLTPDILNNITNIIWHPKEALAIFQIKQDKSLLRNTPFARNDAADGKIMTWLYDFKRYDLVNQEAYFWSADIGDIVWSPNGEKVYFYYSPSGGEKTLISASKNNQNWDRILNFKQTNIENPQISISPDGKYLTLVPRSQKQKNNYVYLFEILTKNLTKLIKNSNNLEAKFAPDSQTVMYTTYKKNVTNPKNNSMLSIINIEDKIEISLDIYTALSKIGCSAESQKILAAVSPSQVEGEKFYQIDAKTKSKTQFAYDKSDLFLNINKVLYTVDNKYAYFTKGGFLYKLELITSKY